ncbi:MAG: 30S ribosomal protein S14 [Verrucomicrobiota bacterium]|nr:30S ribosomal protein S14 [Verrucomicrobiota bacterium]
MAKTCMLERETKRKMLVTKFAAKRAELKATMASPNTTDVEFYDAQRKLAKLPRNSSKVRLRNRCSLTGRPRAFYRKFRVSRITLRELASMGKIPGMTKASW